MTFKVPTKFNLFLSCFAYYFLKVRLHHSSQIKNNHQEAQNSRNQGFFLLFLLDDGRMWIREAQEFTDPNTAGHPPTMRIHRILTRLSSWMHGLNVLCSWALNEIVRLFQILLSWILLITRKHKYMATSKVLPVPVPVVDNNRIFNLLCVFIADLAIFTIKIETFLKLLSPQINRIAVFPESGSGLGKT